jgi:hypothetical protein
VTTLSFCRRSNLIRIQDFVHMAKTAEQQPHGSAQGLDRILTLELVRVAERAAVAAARLRGRGDEMAADQAAVDAMRQELNRLPIAGTVVIGEGERDEAPMLYIGEEVGTKQGPDVDIALDPLEGTTLSPSLRRGIYSMRQMFTWKRLLLVRVIRRALSISMQHRPTTSWPLQRLRA